jgi:hypothetical protein
MVQNANSYGSQDLQEALRNGPQVASSTANAATASTGPFIQATGQMFQEAMADRRFKQQLALEKMKARAQNLMSMLSLGADSTFGAIGAGTKLGALGEMQKFNQGVAGKMSGGGGGADFFTSPDSLDLAQGAGEGW